jgi:hypothetical protein
MWAATHLLAHGHIPQGLDLNRFAQPFVSPNIYATVSEPVFDSYTRPISSMPWAASISFTV